MIQRASRLNWRSIVLTTGATLGSLCLVWTLGLALLGLKPLVFLSGSMSPAINTGDVAFTRNVPASSVEVGDVVSVLTPDGVRVTHRVVSTITEGATTLRIKGDANNTVDALPYTLTSVDLVVGQVPKLGYLLQFGASPWGMTTGAALLLACLWFGFARPRNWQTEGPDPETVTVSARGARTKVLVGAGLAASAVWLGAAVAPANLTLAYYTDNPTIKTPTDGVTVAKWFNCAQTLSSSTGIVPWGHWGFNEPAGTQASSAAPFFGDSAGGHNGVYFVGASSTSVTPSVGHPDACARDASTSVYLSGGTDAAAQYIRTENPIQNENVQSSGKWNTFTVNVWFKTNISGSDDKAGALAGYGVGISNEPVAATDRVLYLDKNGLLKFEVYPGAYRFRASTINAADNKWHMATATLGPAGQCLYLDGALQGSCDASTTTAWQGAANNPPVTYWRFGNAVMSAGFSGIDDLNLAQRAFKGYLDDAAIWKTQLTGDQIREMYRAALPLP